ncbi:phage tail tape measure protein [Pseudomonas sp. MYb2]|uniref:phage tail tape measure protein n=1 Tax=unclassified Pseudomonas TaxID=196821 RepID=UPI000CFF104A|nr:MULTISPECIES: phage tail tape measure protein [unclassified Pseudomonas]PRB46437.1 phage tail tape measure protein [Pseudomonas sp. MYb3]PRC35920.1 phage tail tape measure protein [Pseudomonas sp. MYb2]
MSNKLALGLVIGGAVSSTVGAAFKDVTGRIKKLEDTGKRARVLEKTIGDTMRLRDEWRKAHLAGAKGADALREKLEANLAALKKQGVEVRNLSKAYTQMGRTARGAELKAKGHMQLDEGKQQMRSSVGQAVAASAAMAIPAKISADYGAIIRDIAIKANIANTPEEATLSKTVIDTSRDTGMARNQVAEVVNALVGAGMELDKAMAYAPTAAKFAVGQGSDGTETARMINALGQNAKITDPAMMQKALEAIAYQGQAGSFEAADMARWFPELLAGMGKLGITGMDSVTQLGSMLQVQMKTAGGSDEAANNLKNWMEKIGSGETVAAYQKAGIDYQGSMNTGLQNGKSTLESSFALAQKYIEATDPKKAAEMAKATAAISEQADPEKAKAMIASLESALRTGDLFVDMQVKGALTAYMQNKDLYDSLKKESASATGILDKNLEERRQSSAQKQSEMVQSLDDSMRAIGDAMRPVTDKVVDGIGSVATGLAKLADESPRLVTGIGLATAGLIGLSTAMSGLKMAKGLMNIGRGSLMGNPNIPQKVIVTNMGAGGMGGGLDPGDLDAGSDGKKGKGGKGGKGVKGSYKGPSVGSVVKGAAVVAVIDAGMKAYDTYENAETQDEKAEGYGAAAGGLAGTLAGAAAGAAIGSAVPVIGTIIGGLIGGYLGSQGGDALGGFMGKKMFGTPEELKKIPDAGPLMMADAGKNMAPKLGDTSLGATAKAFAPATTGPLMLTNPGKGLDVGATMAPAAPEAPPVSYDPRDLNSKDAMLLPHFANKVRFPGSELRRPKVIRSGLEDPELPPQIGMAAKDMMIPPASADAAAGALVKPMTAAPAPPKVESSVAIQAPFSLVVNGDVKDGNQLFAQIKPMLDQHYRDMAKQMGGNQLYDTPHV